MYVVKILRVWKDTTNFQTQTLQIQHCSSFLQVVCRWGRVSFTAHKLHRLRYLCTLSHFVLLHWTIQNFFFFAYNFHWTLFYLLPHNVVLFMRDTQYKMTLLNTWVGTMFQMFPVDRSYVCLLCHRPNRPNLSWLWALLQLSQGEHHTVVSRCSLLLFKSSCHK